MPNNPGVVSSVCTKWSKGTGGPSDSEHFNLVAQPIGYRWQNNRDGLQQDDAVAAMRASTGSSGFHEMNHPVVVQPFTKSKRAQSVTDDKTWVDGQVNPTLSLFDQGDTRATTVAVAFPINTLTLGGRPDAVNDKRMTMGVGENGDPQFTLQAAHGHAVAHAFYSTGGTHGVNQHPEVSPAVKVGSGLGIPSPPAVAFSDTSATLKGGSGERGYPDPSDGNEHSMVGTAMTVRRLTARECERLQAFPDDYTLIPWRKKAAADCPDGPRYKALGNSMAVNCMAWIGERIAAVDAQMNERNET
jgi:site-specific DNA-cytosine methylase